MNLPVVVKPSTTHVHTFLQKCSWSANDTNDQLRVACVRHHFDCGAQAPVEMSRWIVGTCAVLFDVDVGPKVEHLVPEDALTPEEKQDVAFHAFPDSMSLELHARTTIRDSCFFFRVKRRGSLSAEKLCSNAASSSSTDERFLYGFVFCRQRQDASLRRGGEQLSVLVLSEHPYSSILRPLSQAAGQMYFSHGSAALHQLYHEVSTWPAPVSGPLLQLHAGHTTIQARLPSLHTLPHPSTSFEPERPRSRTSSLDNVVSHLDGAVNAVLAQQQASLAAAAAGAGAGAGATSTTAGADTASGTGGKAASTSSPSRKPPSGLARTGSLPSRALAGQGFVFTKSVPMNLGRQTSADNTQAGGSDTPQLHTTASEGGLAGNGGGDVGNEASGGAGPAIDTPTLTPAMSSSSVASNGVQRRTSLGAEGQGSTAGVFGEVDVYTSLHAHLPRLWQLWEMLLLGRPLIVVGLSPADCCNATAALISLLAPFPFRQDFRPYFTIHDPAFKLLSSGQLPSDDDPTSLPCLLGVTNPYFIKALSHWPSVLSVGQKEHSAWGPTVPGTAATAALLNPGAAVKALTQRMRGAQSLLTSHSESLWSSYKPLIRPDDVLLSRLLKPQAGDVRTKLARIAVVNNEALRRHFHELTSALLTPFSRYFEPAPDGMVPRWDAAAFLASLPSAVQQLSTLLTDRFARPADLVELYTRFVASANFRSWIELRQQPLAHMLAPEPLPVVLGPGGKPLEEVQLIEMFFESELKLQNLESSVKVSEPEPQLKAELTRLRRFMASLFFGMSEDLQWTCISSPSRRQLLASLQAELSSEQQQQLQRLVARLK